MLSYLTPFIGSVATADTIIPVVADKLVGLVRDKLIAFLGNGGPKFIVSEVRSPDGSLGHRPLSTGRPSDIGDADDGAAAMRFNAVATLVILAVMPLLGAGKMSLGVLDMGPTKQVTRVTLMLDSSGGLLPTSQVTMRGMKLGRVTGIQTILAGLAVYIDPDSTYPVPEDSAVSVENLSVAGEQYIDFKPTRFTPPYFTDDSLIPADRVAPTVRG